MNTVPSKNMSSERVFAFDVETTGLIPKSKNGIKPELNICPYIIQLSFVVYNVIEQKIEFVYNSYINISEDIEITTKITEITGITRKICDVEGVKIEDALVNFYEWYSQCDHIVSHNLDFDREMICIEVFRNKEDLCKICPFSIYIFNEEYEKQKKITTHCTMRLGKDLCNIMVNSKTPNADGTFQQYKKFPKLSELYEKIFHKVPINLHDALIDTLMCLRCFMKIWYLITVKTDILMVYGLEESV